MYPAAYKASSGSFNSYPFLLEIRGSYANTRNYAATFRANITGTHKRGEYMISFLESMDHLIESLIKSDSIMQ